MLYDPKWNQRTKSSPLTLESLAAWLEQQNPAEHYDYDDCTGECMYGQYMRAMGIPWTEARGIPSSKPIGAFESLSYRVASPHPRTFGGALARTRKLIAAR